MNNTKIPKPIASACLTLLTFLPLLCGSALAQDEAPFPVKKEGLRVYTIGNSHTASTLNSGLEALAEAAGHPEHVQDTAGIPGAPIVFIYEHPEKHQPQKNLSENSWDALTLQTYNRTTPEEIEACIKFTGHLLEANPKGRVLLFTIWPSPESWREPELGRSQEWTERVAAAIKEKYPDTPVQVAPTSKVFQVLFGMTERGEIPNIDTISKFFSDGGHMGKYGAYVVNCTFASMLYNESPLDYPLIGQINYGEASMIEEDTAQILKEVVWDVLRTYPPALMSREPAIETRRLDPAVAGLNYSQSLNAVNISGDPQWQISSGDLPAGLNLQPDGKIIGNTKQVGEYPLTIAMESNGQKVERSYTLRVDPDEPPKILTDSLPDVRAGEYVSVDLKAEGGVGQKKWNLAQGTLPPGMQVQPHGMLIGATGKSGSYDITLEVSDNHPKDPQSATKTYTLNIADPAEETVRVPHFKQAQRKPDRQDPELDGKFDESYWGEFQHKIENPVKGDPTATATWDAFIYESHGKKPQFQSTFWVGIKIRTGDKGKTPLDAVKIYFDGNNNDQIIYNYDDTRWLFYRDTKGVKQRPHERVDAGYVSFINGHHAVTETEDGWNVELRFKSGALRGRGIITEFPQWHVVGFDIAVQQGREGDLSETVWMGDENNDTDTSNFGTLVFGGEDRAE